MPIVGYAKLVPVLSRLEGTEPSQPRSDQVMVERDEIGLTTGTKASVTPSGCSLRFVELRNIMGPTTSL